MDCGDGVVSWGGRAMGFVVNPVKPMRSASTTFVANPVKPVRSARTTGSSRRRVRVVTMVTTPQPADADQPEPPPKLDFLAGIARPERYRSSDWARNLNNFSRSLVIRRIQSHVFFTVCACAVIALVNEVNKDFSIFHLSETPHKILGVPASLLLLFRTKSSYDRFWEGRKLWGTLINRCRNLASFAVSSMDNPRPVVSLTAAFAYLLGQHLQGKVRMDEMPIKLREEDYDLIAKGGNVPYRIASRIRDEIKDIGPKGELPASAVRISMEGDVTTLMDVMGACERIVKTPVPLPYSRHTSRFLSLYAMTLPFILVDSQGLKTIVGVAMITWALFAIEEIAHMIEDPFTDKSFSLPLAAYAETIHGSCEQIIGHPLTWDYEEPIEYVEQVDDIAELEEEEEEEEEPEDPPPPKHPDGIEIRFP